MRFVIAIALLASACGNKSGGCPTTDRSQPAGATCCPNFTDTACVSGFFCAALDSTTPTCQAEHSRADLTACNDDIQCISGSCNLLAPPIGECRSQPNMPCQTAVGCAPVSGKTPVCDTTCHPIGNGTGGSFCSADKDCNSRSCVMSRCLAALGEPCTKDTDCGNGTCHGCGFTNVLCSSSADTQECLTDCFDAQGNSVFSKCVSIGQPCNGFNDCSGSGQCSDCSAANNTCMDPTHDLNECLRMCSGGGFSFSC